jgi:[FeFe] hydrogenase H-cluster maturation GTPase HydF
MMESRKAFIMKKTEITTMTLNSTPSAERLHIGIFGRRNAGKSSLINAITGQDLAVVSEISGTTTDPVSKAMELLPLGPVVMIDTPGIDDEGELGALRVKRSYQVLNKTDIAILVVNALTGLGEVEEKLLSRIRAKQIPYLIAYNKADLLDPVPEPSRPDAIYVSALTGFHIYELKDKIGALYKEPEEKKRLVGDLLHPGDLAVLVVPIDKAAPKGRLILPQQQTIRDILEADASAVVCREYELRNTLDSLARKPKVVITDSQAFGMVSAQTPPDIWLTSFSILMARWKGDLETMVQGVRMLDTLKDGDVVLISEGCTHHRQCDDIGSVKLPRWIREYSGVEPVFRFTSGGTFPEDLSEYKLIVHCGGCTLNPREMKYRIACARDAGTAITNYGVLIAYVHGILQRSVEPFLQIAALLKQEMTAPDKPEGGAG